MKCKMKNLQCRMMVDASTFYGNGVCGGLEWAHIAFVA